MKASVREVMKGEKMALSVTAPKDVVYNSAQIM